MFLKMQMPNANQFCQGYLDIELIHPPPPKKKIRQADYKQFAFEFEFRHI